MGELTHLADELRQQDTVTQVDERGTVVGFNVDCGMYNSLSPEVLTVIGRYDVGLYVFPDEEYKYRLVE